MLKITPQVSTDPSQVMKYSKIIGHRFHILILLTKTLDNQINN